MRIVRYLLAVYISINVFHVEAEMVRGYVNKKGKYVMAHFRKHTIKIRKIK